MSLRCLWTIVLLVSACVALGEQKLMPGESTEPFADAKLGVQLASPKDHPMIFRPSNFVEHHEGTLCEFRFAPQNRAPSISGALLRNASTLDAKAYAEKRQPQIEKTKNFEKAMLLSESN